MDALKILYTINPKHVHADFYSGKLGQTFALNGHLVFSREEWDAFKDLIDDYKGEKIVVQMRSRSE